jgi:drug/metabolite transporter (DMT)-like permease
MIVTNRDLVPKAKPVHGLIVLTGVFDTASNVIFLYATNSGSLTIVAVLSSLYPIATVLLARVVLSERMTRIQLAGFASALVATGLIAAG